MFYEAALLVENRVHTGLSGLVVVSASSEVQEQRVIERDGLTLDEARARIAAQLPLEEKVKVANWVIQNNGDRDALAAEVDRVVGELEAKYGSIKAPSRGNGHHASQRPREVALVTGFPAFTARRMIAKLLKAEPDTKIYVLARDKFAPEADALLESLKAGDRAEVLVGDVCDMDLGLSSLEYRALCKELTWIHHLAGIYFMGVDEPTMRRVNISGTRNVLGLARDAAQLERLVHWSTTTVSGGREGTVYEEDLEAGQKFHNGYERSKYDAEKLVRTAMRQLPVTIVRPSIIVGDSKTGEIDRLDGPYYLMVLIATNASGLRLPILGRGDSPLHLVPIDYVIDAAWQVAHSQGAAGKTFHLVDPEPLSARDVFEGVAEHAKTEKPRGHIPRPLARAVLKTPGLARLGRGPLTFLDMIDHTVHYDQSNTAQALAGTTIRCPPLNEYLPVLVQHVLDVARAPASPEALDEVADPLD